MSLSLDGTTGLSASGNITGGNIVSTGSISVAGSLSVAAFQPDSLSTAGNVTGNYIIGNGSQLTGLPAGYTNANLASLGSNNVSTTGTVTSSSVVGGVITGTSLSASGNVTGNYIIGDGSQLTGLPAGYTNANLASLGANAISTTGTITGGNITGGNIITSGPSGEISGTGNITGGNINTGGNVVAAWVTPTTGVSTGGNILVGGYLSVVGNLYVANVVSSQQLVTDDPLVYFNANTPYPYNYAIGFFSDFTGGTGNTYQHTGVVRDYVDNTWKIVSNIPEPVGSTFDFTDAIYDAVKHGNLTVVGTVSATGAITGSSLTVGSIVNSGANGVGNIGSSTTYFNTVFAKATSAQYADLAEMYCADAAYTPGTVLDFGGEQEVTATKQSHSTQVAGIVSTHPSYLMNSALDCTNAVEVALVGRVPCQVVGTIAKGDRLVASSIAGVATRLDMVQYQPGCIIGKALEAYNSETVGTIEVAVGRL